MIEPDDIIRFKAADIPDLPELEKPRRKRKKPGVPPPEDWEPFGCEW